MNTKLSQIEKSLKLKYRLENEGDQVRGDHGQAHTSHVTAGLAMGDIFGHPRNRENEELLSELQRYNAVLLRENSELKAKIKVTIHTAV